MEDLIMVFLVNLVPIICAISAGTLAYNKKEGWGFFLLIALLTIQIQSFNETN